MTVAKKYARHLSIADDGGANRHREPHELQLGNNLSQNYDATTNTVTISAASGGLDLEVDDTDQGSNIQVLDLQAGSNITLTAGTGNETGEHTVTISSSSGSDTHFDLEVNNADVQSDVSTCDFNAGNAITISNSSDDDDASAVDLTFAVSESSINHNNTTNSSQNDAHHGAGDDLSFSGGNINLNDTINIDEIRSQSDDILAINDSAGNDNAEVEAHIFRASDQFETDVLSPSSGDFIAFENSGGSPGAGGAELSKIAPDTGDEIDFQDSSNTSGAGYGKGINVVRVWGTVIIDAIGDSISSGVGVRYDGASDVTRNGEGDYTVNVNVSASTTDELCPVTVPFATGTGTEGSVVWGQQIIQVDSNTFRVRFIKDNGTLKDPDGFFFHVCLK